MADCDPYTIAKFWSKVDVADDDDACWLWRGRTNANGYGRIKQGHAHRFAWSYINGPIPAGAMILHSCDNPPCCNPRHGRPGTAKDNAEDCWSRGRGFRAIGTVNGKAKLTDEQVAAIRGDERKGVVIAAEYGVSQALVSMIRSDQRRVTL